MQNIVIVLSTKEEKFNFLKLKTYKIKMNFELLLNNFF